MTKKPRLRVVPLGGLDEIGKNMTVIEYGDDMILVDAGLMFPDDDHPGVDLILPDFNYVVENAHKLRGIILTHGHEDHTGALPYLLREIGSPVPVLGTKLTLGLVRAKLAEHRIAKPKLREVAATGHVNLGPFGIDFIAVNHSIPDGVALFIRTPAGNLLHTGDFKFDQTPIDGRFTDYAALTKAAKQGVMLLMSDSTNAESPGSTPPETSVGDSLRDIFRRAEGRIVVASFASHIHRVQQICDAAADCGRVVVVTGRSMIQNTGIARELGYLEIDEKNLVDAYDAKDLPAEKTVVLCTGSQGEPLSALARIANRDHKTVLVEPGDTVVIAASPVPGNEMAVSRVINRLCKSDVDVFHKQNAHVHVSGHARAEELKMMLNLVRPQNFMPIHGEARHLRAHARLAEQVGVSPDNVFVMDNGSVLEFGPKGGRIEGSVRSGVVYVDGPAADIGQTVLRDRQLLSRDGIVTIIVTIDAQTGKPAAPPELVMRGVGGGGDTIEEGALARVSKTLDRTSGEGATDPAVIERAVRESVRQFLWDTARTRPMIIPVVLEV